MARIPTCGRLRRGRHCDPASASPIAGFVDEFRWLSNFWPSPIEVDGTTWPTVEHAYQAAKTLDRDQQQSIADCATPGRAKRAGQRVTLRPDWDDVCLDVMARLVAAKFDQHPDLADRLVATGHRPIVEDNRWGDTFWGVTDGVGHNHLGRILMAVRDRLAGH